MGLSPIVHDREEELIDPCEYLPPSFFTESIYLNNSSNSFVEPPSESLTPSSTAIPSTSPEQANSILQPKSSSHSLTSPHHPSTSSPTRSPPCDHPSIPQQPSLSNHDGRRSSPIAIANFPDRPRPHESNRRLNADKVSSMSRFTRTSPPLSPDHVSTKSPESVMHYPPNTTRLMRVVTNGQLRALGAKRALKRREQPNAVERIH